MGLGTSEIKIDKALLKSAFFTSFYIRKKSWLFDRETIKENTIIYDRSDISCFAEVEINGSTQKYY